MDDTTERAEGLSADELVSEDAAELPRREAMSLPGGSLFEGAGGILPTDPTTADPNSGAPAPGAGGTETAAPLDAGAAGNPLAGTGLDTKLPLGNPVVG